MRRLRAFALLAAAALPVHAQLASDEAAVAVTANDGAGAPIKNPELYQEALRLINENRPDEATPLLQRFLRDEPDHAGAWLDLALSECALGHLAEAERLFDAVELRFQPPPSIRELIAGQRASGCGQQLRPASWLLNLARGHSSNVNQGASHDSGSIGSGSNQTEFELDPEFLPKRDSYRQINASYLQALDARNTMLIVQAYAIKHDHVGEQDTTSLLGALEQGWQWGDWRARGTLAYGVATLGGTLYQRQQQVQLRLLPQLRLPQHMDLALAANLSHVEYPTRRSFDSNTWELSSTLSYRSPAQQAQLTLSSLRDHGAAIRPGGDRSGWFANLQWYTALGRGWQAEMGLSHQLWRSERVYSPGLIDVTRRQNTTLARGALQWYFSPSYSLYLEARATRNRENIALFEYKARSVQLGLRWDNF